MIALKLEGEGGSNPSNGHKVAHFCAQWKAEFHALKQEPDMSYLLLFKGIKLKLLTFVTIWQWIESSMHLWKCRTQSLMFDFYNLQTVYEMSKYSKCYFHALNLHFHHCFTLKKHIYKSWIKWIFKCLYLHPLHFEIFHCAKFLLFNIGSNSLRMADMLRPSFASKLSFFPWVITITTSFFGYDLL